MKFALPFFLVFLAQHAFASSSENEMFSGLFRVESCSPSCEQVYVGGGQYRHFFDFKHIEGMHISVVDNPVVAWRTCDGSNKAFEFNIWTFGKRESGVGYQKGIYMSNNLEGDAATRWRNVCDGQFKVSGDLVSLTSGKISLRLKKLSADTSELVWNDKRWGISGTFKLKKITW